MADHPYNIGDEVLIRGRVKSLTGQWVRVYPLTGPEAADVSFEVHWQSITQATPTEPGDRSVLLDRHGYSWQRIDGQWCQGDVCHQWAYLLEHHGPVKVVYRGGEDD